MLCLLSYSHHATRPRSNRRGRRAPMSVPVRARWRDDHRRHGTASEKRLHLRLDRTTRRRSEGGRPRARSEHLPRRTERHPHDRAQVASIRRPWAPMARRPCPMVPRTGRSTPVARPRLVISGVRVHSFWDTARSRQPRIAMVGRTSCGPAIDDQHEEASGVFSLRRTDEWGQHPRTPAAGRPMRPS